jgi:glucose-1-phosphate thymidylyltransferase
VKGIILAGGAGTRLYPLTRVVSKQLLPVYNKPMIYYPLSTLMLAGLRDILIISTPDELPRYETLLGDGSSLGMSFQFASQPRPEGLAHAFVVGADFVGRDDVCLVLGDNLFYGDRLPETLRAIVKDPAGATIFGYYVRDPSRYGVVEFDADGRVVEIQEKPERPASHYAVPGLYFYDNDVVEIAREVRPSGRGELEITDVNMTYLRRGRLRVQLLGRGTTWFDTGTYESLLDASNYIHALEQRQGLWVGAIEEVAFRMGFISEEQLARLAQPVRHSEYGAYLLRLAAGEAKLPAGAPDPRR